MNSRKKNKLNNVAQQAIIFAVFAFLLTLPVLATTITSSSPTNGQTDVSRNCTIRIVLDNYITDTEVNKNRAVLRTSAGREVSGARSWDSPTKTLTFTPSSNLTYGETYIMDVSNVYDILGTVIAPPNTVTFTVVSEPAVSSITPSAGATEVPLNQVITVTFNRSGCDATSIPSTVLYNRGTSARVAAATRVSGTTLTITPSADLSYNTTYVVNLAGVTFNAGTETLGGTTSFSFTTRAGAANITTTASPSTTSVASDQPLPATYLFSESNGVGATFTSSMAQFLDSNGTQIATTNIPVSFSITGGQRSQYSDTVSIPSNVPTQAANGRFTYKRFFYGTDASGNSITVSADMSVTLTSSLGARFTISQLTIDTPVNTSMFKFNSDFSAHAYIQGMGSGQIEGYWYMDGTPIEYFKLNMVNGVTLQITTKNKLFTTSYGSHKLTMGIVSPNSIVSSPTYYTISEAFSNVPSLNTPYNGQFFKQGARPPTFRWTNVPQSLGYKIAISKDRMGFDKAAWYFTEINYWPLPSEIWNSLEPGTYYWAVKAFGLDRQDGPISQIYSFTITDKNAPASGSNNAPGLSLRHLRGAGAAQYLLSKNQSFFLNSDGKMSANYNNTVAQNGGNNGSSDEETSLIEGSVDTALRTSEDLVNTNVIYTRNYNLSLNQPFKNGGFSVTTDWSGNDDMPQVGTQVSRYAFGCDYGPFNMAAGNLSFDTTEFSIYSQYKLGSSFGASLGSTKLKYMKISDNGVSPLYNSASGIKTELRAISFEPLKLSSGDSLKFVHMKGNQFQDVGVPNFSYYTPKMSEVFAIYGKKTIFKDVLILEGEYARGYYNQNVGANAEPAIDNASKLMLTSYLGPLEIGSKYRLIGTNFGTMGNPYLEKDQNLFENYMTCKFGQSIKAKYLLGQTFNNVNGLPTVIGASSNNKQFYLEWDLMKKGWPSNLTFSNNLNTVSTDATAFGAASLTETATTNYGLNYPINDKYSLNLSHSYNHYNDLSNTYDDTANNSVNIGANMNISSKFNMNVSYSSNISRNLQTSANNVFSSMYCQASYGFIPDRMNLNVTYSKNMSASAFSASNTDIMDAQLNYKLKGNIFGKIEDFVVTLEYKYKGNNDYTNTELNGGYNTIVLKLNNLFNFKF